MNRRFNFQPKQKAKSPDKDFPFAMFSAILIGYLTMCGVLYHLGYWSTFSFNFLEYADIGTLFKSIIYPFFSKYYIILLVFLYSFGATFPIFSVLELKARRRPYVPALKFNFERYSQNEAVMDLLTSTFTAVGAAFMLFGGTPWSTVTMPLIGIALGFLLVRIGFLNTYFRDDVLRTIFLVGFVAFAFYQYTIGKKEATNIANRTVYKQIMQVTSSKSSFDSTILKNVYLGATSNFIFTLTPNNLVMIINSGQIQSMVLRNVTDTLKIRQSH